MGVNESLALPRARTGEHLANARFPGILPDMSTIASREADILRRGVDPQRAGWTRATAEAVLALALPKRDASRASTLARKACAGSLSPAEARELEDYKHIGRFLELMQSRARLSLKKAGAA
jgi:hypothetical protein